MVDARQAWDRKYSQADPRAADVGRGVHAAKDAKIIQALRPYLEPGSRVLEAGCGTGRLSIHLAISYRAQCWGVDYSWQGIGFARELAERMAGSVRLVLGDLCRLPAKDDSFDVVFADSVLEHVPEYQVALSEMARVVRPGGVVVVTVPNRLRPDGWDLYKVLKPPNFPQQSFTPRGFRRAFEAAGLRVIATFGEDVLLVRNILLLLDRAGFGGRNSAPGQIGSSRGLTRVPTIFKRMLNIITSAIGMVLPSALHVNLGIVGRKVRRKWGERGDISIP